MGPNGTRNDFDKHLDLIANVDAGPAGVDVRIGFPEGRQVGADSGWLTVSVGRRWTREHGYEVLIHGGNTNDGPADYYEAAIRPYETAVMVARLLERILAFPDDWHDGANEPKAFVAGLSDFEAALWLKLKGDHDFSYRRGETEPTVSERGFHFLDLEGLRKRTLDRLMEEVGAGAGA